MRATTSFLLHEVARPQGDPLQVPLDRRVDGVAVDGPRLAASLDGHAHGPALHRRGLDGHGLGAERQHQEHDHHDGDHGIENRSLSNLHVLPTPEPSGPR